MITRDFEDAEGGRGRATFSDDERHRYTLARLWEPSRYQLPRNLLSIVMLNPSTADERVLDPTIRRCVGFAKREGYHGLLVANIFAFRATLPIDMKKTDDPVGPDNDSVLRNIFMQAKVTRGQVLCGWGAHGIFRDRWLEVKELADDCDVRLVCLGKTSSGQPKHPLYIAADTPFQAYN